MTRLTRQIETLNYQTMLTTAEDQLGLKDLKIAQLSPQAVYDLYYSVHEK